MQTTNDIFTIIKTKVAPRIATDFYISIYRFIVNTPYPDLQKPYCVSDGMEWFYKLLDHIKEKVSQSIFKLKYHDDYKEFCNNSLFDYLFDATHIKTEYILLEFISQCIKYTDSMHLTNDDLVRHIKKIAIESTEKLQDNICQINL